MKSSTFSQESNVFSQLCKFIGKTKTIKSFPRKLKSLTCSHWWRHNAVKIIFQATGNNVTLTGKLACIDFNFFPHHFSQNKNALPFGFQKLKTELQNLHLFNFYGRSTVGCFKTVAQNPVVQKCWLPQSQWQVSNFFPPVKLFWVYLFVYRVLKSLRG